MHFWTNLCNAKCSYAAGNYFVQARTNRCVRKSSFVGENNFMPTWINMCNKKCTYAAGNVFMRVWTNLCDWKCSSYASENSLMWVWTNLCHRKMLLCSYEQFYAILDRSLRQEMLLCSWIRIHANCWQVLHFEFSRQNLNRNVQSLSMWWWLITRLKPMWKKAPPGLQRLSRTSGYWPDPSVPHLGHDISSLLVLKPPSHPIIN